MAKNEWEDVTDTYQEPEVDSGWEDVTESFDIQGVQDRSPALPQPDMTQSEATLRGAAQGLTFDFADEIAGAAGAAKETLFGDARLSDLLDTYEQQRDISREAFREAEQEFPKSYLAGEIGGGILPAIATGGAGAVAAVGKTGLKQAAKQAAKSGAKFGAASAAGRTEEVEDVGQVAKDIGTGTLAGGAFGAVTPAISKGAEKAAKSLKGGVKKVFDSMADLDPKLTDELLSDPTLLKAAKSDGEIAESFKDVANEGLKEFRDLASKGRQKLSTEKDISTNEVMRKFDERFSSLDEIAEKEAIKPMVSLKTDIQKRLGSVTSEKEIQELMDSIAKKAYKGQKKDTADVVTQQLRGMREDFGSIIKDRNPEYAENMFQASQKKKALDELSDRFGLVEGADKRGLKELAEGDIENITNIQFKNKDRTVNRLKELGTEGKYEMNEVLDDIKGVMNIPDEIERSARANKLLKELEKGKTFTTQDLTLAKAMLGFAVNPLIGAGFIAARPAIKSFYKNLDSMPVKLASKAKGIMDTMAKKANVGAAFPAAMVAAESKQKELADMLSSYENKPEKAIMSEQKKFENMSEADLGEASKDFREQGYGSYADSLEKASQAKTEQERAAQRSVLMQDPGFRALMRRKEQDKKKK